MNEFFSHIIFLNDKRLEITVLDTLTIILTYGVSIFIFDSIPLELANKPQRDDYFIK